MAVGDAGKCCDEAAFSTSDLMTSGADLPSLLALPFSTAVQAAGAPPCILFGRPPLSHTSSQRGCTRTAGAAQSQSC